MIRKFSLYNDSDIEKFLKIYYKKVNQNATDLGRMTSLFKSIIDRYMGLDEEGRYEYKGAIKNFNK